MHITHQALYILVGTTVASAFTSIYAYFNIVLSKENKVSEFRQKWIDELRQDVSAYIATMRALHLMVTIHNKSPTTDEEFLKLTINSSNYYNSIHLRINKKDGSKIGHRDNKFLVSIEEVSMRYDASDFEDFAYYLEDASSNASDILGEEWKRVKRGETSYRVAKIIVLIFIILIVTMLYRLITII